MSEAIIVALISGGLSFLGIVVANSRTQAVTDTKLETLAREVREHNNFAKRMPVVESELRNMRERIDELKSHQIN